MSSPGIHDRSLAPVVADLTLAIGQLIRRLRSETPAGELNLSHGFWVLLGTLTYGIIAAGSARHCFWRS